MMFVITFVALLIERFFDCTHLRSWRWYPAYEHALVKYFSFTTKLPFLFLGLLIIPFSLIIGLLDYFMQGWLYGVVRFIFDVLVILYCLGPQNFWADTSMSMQRIFVEANRRVFAVIFWFALLGPFGAILYRMIAITAADALTRELTAQAATVEAILDWIPVRLLSFLFALGGHFSQVFRSFRQNVFLGLRSNDEMLIECGHAALVDEKPAKAASENVLEKSAINLLDRSFVILLVLVAIRALLI